MSRKAKVAISTVAAAVLSGVFWFAYFLFAETFTAADYRAGSEPAEGVIRLKILVALVAGPALYAIGIAAWRRFEAALLGEEGRN